MRRRRLEPCCGWPPDRRLKVTRGEVGDIVKSVFLCHSQKEKPFARRLAKDLERYGLRVWLDEREIRVGDSLRETIEEGINRADFVLVVISRSSLRRQWVRKELNAAFAKEIKEKRRVLLPVLLEGGSIPGFLADKRYANFSRSYAAGLHDLISSVLPGGARPLLETVDCNVLIDILRLDGSLVRFTKEHSHRCIDGEASSYVECLAGEGNVSAFSVSPGIIGRIWSEAGTTHVTAHFPNPLRRGQRLERVFTCLFHDSFTASDEYWGFRVHHPTIRFTIAVRFPVKRPPIEFALRKEDAHQKEEIPNAVTRTVLRGKPALQVKVYRPALLSRYVLSWTW